MQLSLLYGLHVVEVNSSTSRNQLMMFVGEATTSRQLHHVHYKSKIERVTQVQRHNSA